MNVNNVEDDETETAVAMDEPAAKRVHTDTTSSPVWKFATKVSREEGQCNLCGKKYKTVQSTTTNLINHILKIHRATKETETNPGRENKESTRAEASQSLVKSTIRSDW